MFSDGDSNVRKFNTINRRVFILSIATRTPGRSKIIFDAVSNGINSFHINKARKKYKNFEKYV